MGFTSRIFRIPKPQRFLYALSLSTGASLITFTLLFNKLTGFYGILALLTGFHLSPVQFSMYIYSVLALILTVYLTPHIKRSTSPLHCLALAWLYTLDSLINATYTALFGITWFLVLISHATGSPVDSNTGPGAGTIGDTAGFTDPTVNASAVTISDDGISHVSPASSPAGTSATTNPTTFVWGRESINSLGIIVALWTLRAYFCLVMLAWARSVLRSHIAVMAARDPSSDYSAASRNSKLAESPFDEGKPEGSGWGGKLGRVMVGIGRSYWLGVEENENWMSGVSGKFSSGSGSSSSSSSSSSAAVAMRRLGSGVAAPINTSVGGGGGASNPIELAKINSERENRRRSGTGPPLPSVAAAAAVVRDQEGGHNHLKVPGR